MSKTIKDVAKHTGLSLATISKFLNGGTVKAENKTLIEEAVQALDYKVNEFARGLKTQRTMTIGILVPRFEMFFTGIISVIENLLTQAGYSTIVCDSQDDPALEKEKLHFLMGKMVDGMIIVPLGEIVEELQHMIAEKMPFVLIDQIFPGIVECDAVVADNVNASYYAVKHLILKGHRRIGIICGPEDLFTSIERLKGYHRIHEDYHLPIEPTLMTCGNYSVDGGYRAFKELMALAPPPTAILVTNYDMTVGALMAINELGLEIPKQMSFMGFDEILLFRVLKPSLSIVTQPVEQIGAEVVRILLKRLKGDVSNFPELVRLETQLLLGDSVDEHLGSQPSS